VREGPRSLDVGVKGLSDLTWKVAQGSSLTILTVDEREREVPGAEFLLTLPNGSLMGARTNERGRFDSVGELDPGSYEIAPQQPFDAEHIHIDLHEGDESVTAKLKIAGSASIVATVCAHGGGPIDGMVGHGGPAHNFYPRTNGPIKPCARREHVHRDCFGRRPLPHCAPEAGPLRGSRR